MMSFDDMADKLAAGYRRNEEAGDMFDMLTLAEYGCVRLLKEGGPHPRLETTLTAIREEIGRLRPKLLIGPDGEFVSPGEMVKALLGRIDMTQTPEQAKTV